MGKIGAILGWIFGVLFLLAGLTSFGQSVILALAWILLGITILLIGPNPWGMRQRMRIPVTLPATAGLWVAAVVLLMVGAAVSPARTGTTPAVSPTAAPGTTPAAVAQAVPTTAPQPAATPKPANTPAPTATPVPPTATRVPPTATPIPPTATPVPPVELSGRGQTATDGFRLPSPISRAILTHQGRSNFIVRAFREGQGSPVLLVNRIGNYSGERLMAGQGNFTLDIQADGPWTVRVEPVGITTEAPLSGTGDTVSGMFSPPRSGPWEIAHDGRSNFIVRLICNNSNNLVQNEVGPVSGSRVVQFGPGPCLWDVSADGAWKLEPRG